MKKIAFVILVSGLIAMFSCDKDDGWISMSAMESAVWIEINAFRADSGKAAVTANYDTMVEQAKKYSSFLAAGNEDANQEEFNARWDVIFDRLGGTNPVAIITQTTKGSSDISVEDIIDPIKEQAGTAEALLEDVSIGGVGIVFDKDGNAYTSIFMLKVE
jgi:hypothetical protein